MTKKEKIVMMLIVVVPMIMLFFDGIELRKMKSEKLIGIEKITLERLAIHNDKMHEILKKYKIPFFEYDNKPCDCTIEMVKKIKDEMRESKNIDMSIEAYINNPLMKHNRETIIGLLTAVSNQKSSAIADAEAYKKKIMSNLVFKLNFMLASDEDQQHIIGLLGY